MRPVVGCDVPDVAPCTNTHHAEARRVPRSGAFRTAPRLVCDQCAGDHDHRWVEALVVEPVEHVRRCCYVCGATACSTPGCLERRAHLGPCLTDRAVLGLRLGT